MLCRSGRSYVFRGNTSEEIDEWIKVTTLMYKEQRDISLLRHTRTGSVGSAGLFNARLDFGREIRLAV